MNNNETHTNIAKIAKGGNTKKSIPKSNKLVIANTLTH